MSTVSELITKSLKEKYRDNHNAIVTEGVNINIEELDKIANSILTEETVNNLASSLLIGNISNDIITTSKSNRKTKK